uniref:Hypoxia up-regulated protein 1 n=2 Tax=Wuchereria bancrofti TaxID=6293 RepID=A0A1I8ECJ6_WUCBA
MLGGSGRDWKERQREGLVLTGREIDKFRRDLYYCVVVPPRIYRDQQGSAKNFRMLTWDRRVIIHRKRMQLYICVNALALWLFDLNFKLDSESYPVVSYLSNWLTVTMNYKYMLCLVTVVNTFFSSDASLAAMSIDFGSQWIKMALVKPGVPMEMVLNEEAHRKTPNLIIVKDNERLFGDAALPYSVKYSKNSFTHLVDLLGKKINNPIISLYKQRFPHLKFIVDDARDVLQFDVDGENYSIESIVAMILKRCREVVEKFAKQPVRDVVITVPVFFNQAERRALVAAAKIAELNLLQLLNDHTAAGLNYGAFRRKEITGNAQTLLIYDVGATKVTASVLEYVLVEEKKRGEKDPVMTTLGVGYSRIVGGFEITQRLRDIFVSDFRKTKKTKTDITENSRSMAKMLQEAERVKIVLSANVNFTAQIENVHEEHDFTMSVTRAMLEDAIRDLEEKLVQPIVDALKMADLSPKKVNQVVLMGGGSRVPLIQEFVQKFFKKKELGKFLNTDEAIAMGAVYQAAHLSKGFKVKRFGVDFVSAHSKDETGSGRLIHRPIYPMKSFVPASKKVLSFTSFTEDFSVNVNYGEMRELSTDQLMEFGSLNISEIKIGGVTDVYLRETAKEGIIFKGIKIHFDLDNSGILHVDGAEMLLEQPSKAESTLASLAEKITGLFSSNNKVDETQEKNEESLKSEEISDKSYSSTNTAGNQTKVEKPTGDNVTSRPAEANKTATNAAEKKQEEKPLQIKISLKLMENILDVPPISDSEITSAKNRIAEFERKEREKAIREEAHHNLESLAVDLSDKLARDEFRRFLTADEHIALQKEISQVKSWLEDDVDMNTPTAEFIQNRKTIDDLLQPIKIRMAEDQERPSVVAELISMFNHTEIFLHLAQNLTEAEVFTEVEINTLTKLLDETKDWLTTKMELQNTLKPTDQPALPVSEGKEKLMSLDREVKYLLSKMKFAKPKVRKEEKTKETIAENNETLPETIKEVRTDSDEKSDETSKDGQPLNDANNVRGDEELKNDEQKDDKRQHDGSEL